MSPILRKYVLLLILTFFLVAGCAHRQIDYDPPTYLSERYVCIANKVLPCLELDKALTFWVADSKEINAWATGDRVYFTEGLLQVAEDDILMFVMCHELAHVKLNHLRNINIVSYTTTGIMLIVNSVVPGAGYLNHLINPAICNNYSKSQELEADKEASKICLRLGISIERQVEIMYRIKAMSSKDGGGFWDQHPSWDERIENITINN